MSVVKVQGNASGTGILTIAAPNTNTDRTLTLPDQTGTVLTNAGPFTASSSASAGAVTIDASNNVGIGTSSPAVRLQVDAGSSQEVARFNTTATGPFVGWYISGTRKGYQQWETGSGWILDSEAASTGIIFRTQNSERARIDSSGRLLVGTTSAAINESGLGVVSSGNAMTVKTTDGANNAMLVWNAGTSGTRNLIQFFTGSSYTSIGLISTNGSSTSYNTSSDYRLKENVAPMVGALAKVAALKPVTYRWKSDGSSGEGFIAHELAEVVPDCVTGEKDAVNEDGRPIYQGIDTSFLVATLTAAIQEQQSIIEQLTARIVALEAK